MSRKVDYRALFKAEPRGASHGLAHELEGVLTPHPAPEAYREHLRAQLLAAASDESIYRRGVTRQLVLALTVVITVGLSVAGLVAWRRNGNPFRRAEAL